MKKALLFLIVCIALSACENKTSYLVENNTSEDIWFYQFVPIKGRSLVKSGHAMASSSDISDFTFYGVDTIVIQYKDKFYEEVSKTGYSLLNQSAYVKKKEYSTAFEKDFVFVITEDYIFSLPKTEKNDSVFILLNLYFDER